MCIGGTVIERLKIPLKLRFIIELSNARKSTRKSVYNVGFFWVFLIHVILADHFNDISWITAYGTILTVVAVLVAFTNIVSPNLDKEMDMPAKKQREFWVDKSGGGSLGWEVSEDVAHVSIQEHIDKIDEQYGNVVNYYVLVLIGALLAGYTSPLMNLWTIYT